MTEETPNNALEEGQKSLFREWLEKLQQESWQLELIISGFVLYGIYNSKGVIRNLEFFNDDHDGGFVLNVLETILETGWRIFFINLLIHVILRSLWIGAIGLRYVSGEINYEDLNYSKTFTKYLKRKVGDYDDFIGRLEKICSVLFSYTFLLFLFFVSIIAFFMVLALPFFILGTSEFIVDSGSKPLMLIYLLYMFIMVMLGLVVFVDFVSLGGLKRIKDRRFSKIYMPIYWLFSHITLSFLYRPLLYNFIDDKYTRRLFFFSFPYIFFIVTADSMFTQEETVYMYEEDKYQLGMRIDPHYYDDLYDKAIKMQSLLTEEILEVKPLRELRLSQYKVTEPYLQLFVKYDASYDKVIEKVHDIPPHYEKGWNFSLFDGDHRLVDSTEYALKDSFKIREREVYKDYKIYRDSVYKLRKDSIQKAIIVAKRDSLKLQREELYQKRKDGIDEFRKRKLSRIQQLMKEQVSISIDGVSFDDSLSCYFTNHHLFDNKGMMYNIPVRSLDIGDHLVKIEKIVGYSEENDSLYHDEYRLPILKIK